jgi:MinD superfamily P-loop ATPase
MMRRSRIISQRNIKKGETYYLKQLVILSGKGGTGKTSMAAAFAHLAHDGSFPVKAVLADADVDAANLEMVLRPKRCETHDFIGGSVAVIDPQLCQGCGVCEQICRFDAVLFTMDGYTIDPIACDGCAACAYQCPEEAIQMEPQLAGRWYHSESRFGPLFHADLFPAQENSGKMVTLVRQNARLSALDQDMPLVIIDGPPGIGCPVISAAAGADLVLIVTEPGVAGVHDLHRILETTMHFHIPALVVVNKADIYPQGVAQIEALCVELDVGLIGQIPFDPTVTEAMRYGEPVTAYRPQAISSQAMSDLWQVVLDWLFPPGGLNGKFYPLKPGHR